MNGVITGIMVAAMCLLVGAPSMLISRRQGRPLIEVDGGPFGLVPFTLAVMACVGVIVSIVSLALLPGPMTGAVVGVGVVSATGLVIAPLLLGRPPGRRRLALIAWSDNVDRTLFGHQPEERRLPHSVAWKAALAVLIGLVMVLAGLALSQPG